MSNQRQFGYGVQAPRGSIPLAYCYVPVPNIGQNVNLIGTSKYTIENKDGLITKGIFPTINIVENNVVNTFIPSGIITKNLVLDPSFLYGINGPFWFTSVGTWSTSGGRNYKNSYFETGREPALEQGISAQNPCAYVSWATTGSTSQLYSSFISARAASGEGQYNIGNVIYELSLWIASDPVDSYLYRYNVSASGFQTIVNNTITISVFGCDASGNIIEVLSNDILSYNDVNSRDYFIETNTLFKLFRSSYFQINNVLITQFQINIEGTNINGIYFDDVRLRSYLYAQNTSIDTGGSAVWTTQAGSGNITQAHMVAGPNLINNPTFIDSNFTNGDFNNSFRNLIPDYSFELLQWIGSNAEVLSAPGLSRTGNNVGEITPLFIAPVSGYLYNDISGLSNTITYAYGGWVRVSPLFTGAGTPGNTQLVIELYSASGGLLNTILGPFLDLSSLSGLTPYVNYNFTWSSSGYPSTVKWRLKILGNTVHSKYRIIWDDMYLTTSLNPLTPWTFLMSQPINGSYGVLSYLQSNNDFLFHGYSDTTNRHYIYDSVNIYKNSTYNFTQAFAEAYFNTEQVATSSSMNVSINATYGISFNLRWQSGVVRASFAEPFVINYGSGPIDVEGWGSLSVIVIGYNSSGGVTEEPQNYIISQQVPNLPNTSFYDTLTGWYYAPVTLPTFTFTNPNTMTANVTFGFVATSVGIDTVIFQTFTATPSGYNSNYNGITVYNFSNTISVDGMSLDQTDAWRLEVKDGIFESRYIVQASEPSGSWLIQSGFNVGDDLTLIYTVPEYNLSVQWVDPNNPTVIKHYQEVYKQLCSPIDNNTISFGNQNIEFITQVIINGTIVITGDVSGIIPIADIPLEYPNLVSAINPSNGTMTFINSINDNDVIEASYLYKAVRYVYRGYYDNDTWYDLDINPSAGHRWHFCKDSFGKAGYDLVNNAITMYLLPTAAYYTSGNISGNYNYKTAFDLNSVIRPYSFLRHSVGVTLNEGNIPWYPSAAVIGKVFITSPGGIDDYRLTDIRTRGGGLAPNYKFTSNNQPADFIEETRLQIPVGSNNWLNSGVFIYPNDVLTVLSYGWASGSPSGNPYTILPGNSLWATINATTPTSGSSGTIFIGSYYTANIVPSVISSGQAPSGILFFQVINANKGLTGELYVVIRVKRKFYQGWVWDTGTYDGNPIMSNGVCIINVPQDVLTGSSGYTKMSTQQVENAVNKNVAAGVLPIVQFV